MVRRGRREERLEPVGCSGSAYAARSVAARRATAVKAMTSPDAKAASASAARRERWASRRAR